MTVSTESRATLGCLFAGAVWGLFWIPLRGLEERGLESLWVTVVYLLVPGLFFLPVLIWRWRRVRQAGLSLQLTVAASGVALTLYSAAILYTDVVRALMLFHLMPIWSILLARFILNERITPLRSVAVAMAIAGMLIMFGLGAQFPVPRNAGDWMGFAAGLVWAVTMVRIRSHPQHASVDLTAGFFLWALVISAAAAVWLRLDHMPAAEQVLPALPPLLAFILLLLIPGTYAALWGPKHLNPGVVGLLFMSEIVVGAITAAFLAGEPFGAREFTGVVLITLASLLEPMAGFFPRRTMV